jgi:hypothetical protein
LPIENSSLSAKVGAGKDAGATGGTGLSFWWLMADR